MTDAVRSERGSDPAGRGVATGRVLAMRRLTRAVFAKQLILLKRYWINTSMLLVTMYVFFAMIFYGGQAAAGPAIESSLDGIVVGFFLFTASLAAFFATAQDIQREAQWGTLEQLFMSPHGIGRVMAVKSVWNVAFSVGLSFVLLAVMLLTTDRSLSVDVLTVTTITVVSVASVLGIGFLFAGLSLLYKRIENVQQIMQFAFIGLIAVPATELSRAMGLLPLSQGSAMLHTSMTGDVALWEFQTADLAILTASGALYLVAGYVAFHLCVRRARRLGVMGHY